MELQTFVKTTLIEIARAVKEAGEQLARDGTVVNPGGRNSTGGVLASDQYDPLIQEVSFDVAVTVAHDTTTGKAGRNQDFRGCRSRRAGRASHVEERG